jgi:hypothetical protein
MKVRYLIAATSAAVLMSSFAMAQENPAETQGSTESCATLQTKFDKDVLTANSANVGQAQSLREQGGKLCSEGKNAEGVGKLKEAIELIKAEAPAQPAQPPQS